MGEERISSLKKAEGSLQWRPEVGPPETRPPLNPVLRPEESE